MEKETKRRRRVSQPPIIEGTQVESMEDKTARGKEKREPQKRKPNHDDLSIDKKPKKMKRRRKEKKVVSPYFAPPIAEKDVDIVVFKNTRSERGGEIPKLEVTCTTNYLESNTNSFSLDSESVASRRNLIVALSNGKERKKRRSNGIIRKDKNSDFFDNAFHGEAINNEGEGDDSSNNHSRVKKRDSNSRVKEEERDEKVPHFVISSRDTSCENDSERVTSFEKTSFEDLMLRFEYKSHGTTKSIGKMRVCNSHSHKGVKKEEISYSQSSTTSARAAGDDDKVANYKENKKEEHAKVPKVSPYFQKVANEQGCGEKSNSRLWNGGCRNFPRMYKRPAFIKTTTLSAFQKKDEAYLRKTSDNT